MFPEDYVSARGRFRAAVEAAGGERLTLPIAANDSRGGELTIDVGWFGARRPDRAFIHSCGVHGVEAFAGSAIQCAWLSANRPSPAAGDAVVFVHAVNPFGMAWLRRVNAHNVDLNRNRSEERRVGK